jgi:hypothetical protein
MLTCKELTTGYLQKICKDKKSSNILQNKTINKDIDNRTRWYKIVFEYTFLSTYPKGLF